MAQIDLKVVLMIAMCICSISCDPRPQESEAESEVTAWTENLGNNHAPGVHCSCNCALPAPTDRQTCDSVDRMQADLNALLAWKGTATNLLHHLKNSLQVVSKRLEGVSETGGSSEGTKVLAANLTTVLSRKLSQQLQEATEKIIWEAKGPYPMGVESGAIPDAQMTASSEYNDNHGPRRGRLYIVNDDGGIGAWCAKTNDGNQWLQVDLGKVAEVWGVVTQGRFRDYKEWVTTYKLHFSTDGNNWASYTDGSGRQKVFQGNIDFETPLRHLLAKPVTARHVRFIPLSWNVHICMRVEVLGRFS
ncbi:discoidin, CUB and LCCL domain-containing protein 2-like isoform X2 [Branchiostoma lanceolatum]|uniref:discoidin, CUB and LCCL domain-containing protein 2-like isoform X2 n=1 Tax=Branchiostoma lanceolatum TaxID=7740 RepID=UPI003455504B